MPTSTVVRKKVHSRLAPKVRDTRGLLKRARILEAVSKAANYFLRATPEVWEKNVVAVLAKLGAARGSGRAYVCKNSLEADGSLTVQVRYEWKATGEEHVYADERQYHQDYAALGLSRWVEVLSQGKVVSELVAALPDGERRWNLAHQARAILIIPVFVGTEWWGYLGFEDWQAERPCSVAEIEALGAVAITFGEAIKRKRIEQELEREKQSVVAQEKARLTASIHSISLGFVMTDIQGEVLLFNHAVNDILGKSMVPWTLPLLQEKFGVSIQLKELIYRSVREVQEIQMETDYQDKHLRLYLTPIRILEDSGQVIGVVILIDDMTEERNLQRSRDEFFAVASHELRTPLTAIKGYTEMITHYYPETVANENVKRMLDDIHVSTVRLIDLVNEYLDASRLEVQRITVTTSVFDVVPVVRKAMETLSHQAAEKHLVWELQVPADYSVRVTADPARTEQVLLNLLGNALKFTERGGVYVKITEVTPWVKIHCYDTGEGIKPEEHPYLFQKFKRLGDRVYVRDVTSGTGMGLYISRLLAEAMGGTVSLEKSAPGEGSAFVLALPTA